MATTKETPLATSNTVTHQTDPKLDTPDRGPPGFPARHIANPPSSDSTRSLKRIVLTQRPPVPVPRFSFRDMLSKNWAHVEMNFADDDDADLDEDVTIDYNTDEPDIKMKDSFYDSLLLTWKNVVIIKEAPNGTHPPLGGQTSGSAESDEKAVNDQGDRLYGPWLLTKNKGASRHLLSEDNGDKGTAQDKSLPSNSFSFSMAGNKYDKSPLEQNTAKPNGTDAWRVVGRRKKDKGKENIGAPARHASTSKTPASSGAVSEPRTVSEVSNRGHGVAGMVSSHYKERRAQAQVLFISAGSGLDPMKHQVSHIVESPRKKNNRNSSGPIGVDIPNTAAMAVDSAPL
ncbi:RING/U-box superfamily protein [Striga asiatica]|uniref:RING/U-box superfamily protein n=1 Tax=Striga asiatica TaxID=4170 RepID=A0A5A7Q8J0_STRAF|nr:RING/U-box superfamily protein [Striga asiatica]